MHHKEIDMRKPGYAIVLFLLGILVMTGLSAAPALGGLLDECLDQDMDSCDFLGFSKLCHALADNPQPCNKLCPGLYSGDDVGNCLRCCEQIIPQLGMDPQVPVEVD